MGYPQSVAVFFQFSFFQKPHVLKKKKILYPLTKGYSQSIDEVFKFSFFQKPYVLN